MTTLLHAFKRALNPKAEAAFAPPSPGAGYWYYDAARGLARWDERFLELLGAADESGFTAQLPQAAAEWFIGCLDSLKSGASSNPCVLECSMRQLFASPHVLQGGDGEPQGAVLWLYDVTPATKPLQRIQAENAKLKADLKHYSTILNYAPFPLWQRDADLHVRFYNMAYAEIAEESQDGSPEIDRKSRILAKTAHDTGLAHTERRHVIIGGERKLYQLAEHPVPEEGIQVGVALDMTEVELLQEEMQRYASAQADLLESTASAMAVYGPDMRLKSFNYAFVALWKLDEAWLENQPTYGEILEVLREKRRLPEQANFQAFKQQQVKLFTGLIEPREEFFYLPDGKALRVIAIPHALGGILFAYEDVTDRLALERSYNTLIAVQRETLDNLHEGVAVFGEDGRLKLFNHVYLSMWNIEWPLANTEPHARELVELAKPYYAIENWESFRDQYIAQITGRESARSRLERSDGKVIDCSVVPLPDGATLITYIDVTDSTLVERSLVERNEALQEADRLKTEFLANVSYELRSPLTSITGFSDMLRQQYFGELNEKQKEYVDGIHQSSLHLMQLVNDILDLASIEAGYMQLEVAKFDIAPMLKAVYALIQQRAREHEVTVMLECAPRLGKMLGDETRLKQVLFNLLSNAVKYCNPGGKITLGARELEGKEIIELWVSDDGPGIPLEEQARVFEKFYKGNNPNVPKSRAKPGTGLGLSIVKNFVELHGGEVVLESIPSQGTAIRCRLPRNNPELAAYAKGKK